MLELNEVCLPALGNLRFFVVMSEYFLVEDRLHRILLIEDKSGIRLTSTIKGIYSGPMTLCHLHLQLEV